MNKCLSSMARSLALGLGISLFLSGCSQPDDAPATEAVATDVVPELVSRQDLFDNPSQIQGRISPDGQWVSWLAPDEGVMNIWVAPADDPAAAKPVTQDRSRGIPIHYWTFDSKYLLYTQDQGGNENHRVYVAAIDGSEVRTLTPVGEGVRAIIWGLSRHRPDTVIVGLNDRNPQLFDLYEINIASGDQSLLIENPGYTSWGLDNNLKPRTASRPLADGGNELLVIDEDEPRVIAKFDREDALTSRPIGFSPDNANILLLDSRGRDTAALVRMSLATQELTILGADDRADISDVLFDQKTDEVIAYAYEYTNLSWQGLNEAADKLLASIANQVQGNLTFVSGSLDGAKLIVAADDATDPLSYYVYDTTSNSALKMFDSRPKLAGVNLQPMQSVVIEARDGLPLVSYLTLPSRAEYTGSKRSEKPLPMVLFVHGGPWARDSYGYNSSHQWLSDRGYAVLSVNYRGSTGFGKSFLNAAVKEFAGKMHDDLIDAVNWAVAQGIADPDKVAIMGGSYGGYATLVGLTFTPDVFACGVDIVGPSNLVTLIESFPAYWGPSLAGTWYTFVGDPENETDRADMTNRSPITRVADIQSPLLIAQGENDPRVTKLESDQIVEAMSERDLPVTYLNYPDEGHGFARPENNMSFSATAEAFLSQCLGGRYEPIGEDFDGSSVQVLHGAEYVPGLAEALAVPAN